MSISSITVLLQPFKVDPFTVKYFNKILLFSNSIYFLRTPLHDCINTVKITWYAFFSHISAIPLYILIKLVLLFALCILYKHSNLQIKITA